MGAPGGPGDVIELESLSRAHTHELVREMLAGRSAPTGVAEHIATRSDGNPLFAEQVVALEVARDFVGTSALPLTLRGLLQERIDHLKTDEREVLARAAVEGVVFHRSVLMALADDELPAEEGAATMALMRKGFIRTTTARRSGRRTRSRADSRCPLFASTKTSTRPASSCGADPSSSHSPMPPSAACAHWPEVHQPRSVWSLRLPRTAVFSSDRVSRSSLLRSNHSDLLARRLLLVGGSDRSASPGLHSRFGACTILPHATTTRRSGRAEA